MVLLFMVMIVLIWWEMKVKGPNVAIYFNVFYFLVYLPVLAYIVSKWRLFFFHSLPLIVWRLLI